MNKLRTVKELKKIIKKFKKEKKRIVFTNGCFDLIHPGHIKILKEAKRKGDILIVGLNSDNSIKALKGKDRPILNQKARTEILSAIEYVDYIVIFKEETPYKLIKILQPDYLVKGADWQKDKIIGKELVKKVYRVDLKRNFSTTILIKKIKNEK